MTSNSLAMMQRLLLGLAVVAQIPTANGDYQDGCSTLLCQNTTETAETIESLLVFDLIGDPRQVTDMEVEMMAEALVQVYECDDDLRNVTSVAFHSLDVPGIHVDINPGSETIYSLVLQVDWQSSLCQDTMLEHMEDENITDSRRWLNDVEKPRHLRMVDTEGQSNSPGMALESYPESLDCNCTVPTEEELIDELSLEFQEQAVARNHTPAITGILGIEEHRLIPNCNDTQTPWSAVASLTVAFNASELSSDQLSQIGQAMFDTYESWKATCDPYQRRIHNYNITVQRVTRAGETPLRRLLDDSELSIGSINATSSPSAAPSEDPSRSGPDLYTLLFEVDGSCNGCSQDLGFFDQISGRRRTAEVPPFDFDNGIDPARRGLTCTCPVDVEQRGVDTEEYIEALMYRVANDEVLVALVSTTIDLSDVAPIMCGKFSDFFAFASINFIGSAENITQREFHTLSTGLVHSYNQNAALVCDAHFRTLVHAEVMNVVDRRKLRLDDKFWEEDFDNEDSYWANRYLESQTDNTTQSSNSSTTPTFSESLTPSLSPTLRPSDTPTTSGPDLYTLLFMTTGVCNGCESGINLFDDQISGRRRQLSTLDDMAGLPNSLGTDGKCYCNTNVVEEIRGQTKDEFLYSFSEYVEKKNEQGELEHATTVKDVREPTSAPSATPSEAPSVSVEPSHTPTTEPSSVPSVSKQPSSHPSIGTMTVTPSISSQPTLPPSLSAPPTNSLMPSFSLTGNSTVEPSAFPSETSLNSNSSSLEPTVSQSATPTNNDSTAPSAVNSVSPSFTPTRTPTVEPSAKPTTNPTQLPTVEPTVSPSMFPSQFPSTFPSSLPSGIPTVDPTLPPTQIASSTPTRVPSLFPSAADTSEPTTTHSEHPTAIPTLPPSSIQTSEPSSALSGGSTLTPTTSPSPEPTAVPSGGPTKGPTETPSEESTAARTSSPSDETRHPTEAPSEEPTQIPTGSPTDEPTRRPVEAPSEEPTQIPTSSPSDEPTRRPVEAPSKEPTQIPTSRPSTPHPSMTPTTFPTWLMTSIQTPMPSTNVPSDTPTDRPSSSPTETPTDGPSPGPSLWPSPVPSDAPSQEPTAACYYGDEASVTDACDGACCSGSGACSDWNDGMHEVCVGGCMGDYACYNWTSSSSNLATNKIAKGGCSGGSYSCAHWAGGIHVVHEDACQSGIGTCAYFHGSTNIRPNGCNGDRACYAMGTAGASVYVGRGACSGEKACYELGLYSLWTVGVRQGACVGDNACESLAATSDGSIAIYGEACVGDNSCNGLAFGSTIAELEVAAHVCSGDEVCSGCRQNCDCDTLQVDAIYFCEDSCSDDPLPATCSEITSR